MQLAQRDSSQVAPPKCRLCECFLTVTQEGAGKGSAHSDDLGNKLCADCKHRPEVRVKGLRAIDVQKARPFTAADKSLVSKVRSFMLPGQILSLLNERLTLDLGPRAVLYTLDDLQPLLSDSAATAASGDDWASLRQTLAKAKRDGHLRLIDKQCLEDFAVVYSLSAGQLSRLKDVFGPIFDERKLEPRQEGAQ